MKEKTEERRSRVRWRGEIFSRRNPKSSMALVCTSWSKKLDNVRAILKTTDTIRTLKQRQKDRHVFLREGKVHVPEGVIDFAKVLWGI